MTTDADLVSAPALRPKPSLPPTRRINRGRSHSYLLDGEPVDSVTSILADGIPKKALIDWAARTTAGYAIDHWDELAATGPSERLRTLEQARWETSRRAMAKGTDVHQLAMRLAAREEVQVPDEISGYVDAYLQFAADWEPQELLVEVPVFNRTLRYAGTPDLVAILADGWTWLIDWKTATSGIWPESAIQLAAYRHAEFYLDDHGNEQPMPPIDFCGCVWLRQDGYDLHRVDASEHTFRVFQYARQVARFGHEPRERYVDESLSPPARDAA